MTSIDDDEMERRANALRRELGLDAVDRLDGVDVLEKLKFKRFLRDYIVVPDHALGDADARYSAEDRIIYLRESTEMRVRSGDPRALWTVAHEVGHLALGHATRDRKTNGDQHSPYNSVLNREETDAHRFAAAFLAPAYLANANENTLATELSDRFGLSKQAAERRRDELVRQHRRKHGVKRPLPPKVLDFLAEASRRGHPIGSSLKREIENHAIEVSAPVAAVSYEGNPCPNPTCGEFRMVRRGLYTECQACGARTGRD